MTSWTKWRPVESEDGQITHIARYRLYTPARKRVGLTTKILAGWVEIRRLKKSLNSMAYVVHGEIVYDPDYRPKKKETRKKKKKYT